MWNNLSNNGQHHAHEDGLDRAIMPNDTRIFKKQKHEVFVCIRLMLTCFIGLILSVMTKTQNVWCPRGFNQSFYLRVGTEESYHIASD